MRKVKSSATLHGQGIIGDHLKVPPHPVAAYRENATSIVDALDVAGLEIVRKPQPGSTAENRVEFARRTGCWDGVSDRDYREWLASLQQTVAFEDARATRKAADDIGFALRVAYWSGAAGRRYEHAQDARDVIAELARDGIEIRSIPGRTVVLDEHDEAAIREAAAAPVPPGEGIVSVEERPITDAEHAVKDAEIVIATTIRAGLAERPKTVEDRAHEITEALAKAGFEVRYRPLDILPEHAEHVTLEPGKLAELPAGAKMTASEPEPERDDWGLSPHAADGVAARYGCRIDVSGLDDPHVPLTADDIGDHQYVVVTERASGRLVGLVEAWSSEDGDPLVPRAWLGTVLSAWKAAADPQRAA